MDMPKKAMKAAERAANKGSSSGKGNDSEEHESHQKVNVDLPFMATISRLGNGIEQGNPLIHRAPSLTNSEGKSDDDKQDMCADRRAVDDESTIAFTDRARALKIGVAVKRKSKQVPDKKTSSSESTQSATHHEDHEDKTVNKSELGAGGRGNWDRNRSGEEQEASREGLGLLAWMQNMPPRIAMHGHGSLSLPSSPMLAIRPGTALNIAARSGMGSGIPSLRAGGVESMPASPFPAMGLIKGGSPLSAASTRVNADSRNFSRAWEADDSYADSPNVKTSVPKSKNSLVGKIRGLVNRDGQSLKGSPLQSISTRATEFVGIFV